jgi:superoxide dismutase, Fe-Mn family
MIVLPALPYAYDALQPVVSETTMRTHHDKHHARYVEVTNELLADTLAAHTSLEEVVTRAWHRGARKLFNNAAQALNHGFYWDCMSPDLSPPSGEFAQALSKALGGDVRGEFIAQGLGHFGSGWVWLTADRGAMAVATTHDGDTVMRHDGVTPLLVCDLWEHAYYLDYKNDRAAYLAAWWDGAANWAFAQRQYEASLGRGEAWSYPTGGFAAAETAEAAAG